MLPVAPPLPGDAAIPLPPEPIVTVYDVGFPVTGNPFPIMTPPAPPPPFAPYPPPVPVPPEAPPATRRYSTVLPPPSEFPTLLTVKVPEEVNMCERYKVPPS